MAYDKDALLAKQGIVNQALLDALKEDDFFKNLFQKLQDPNYLAKLMYIVRKK
jgi:anhydro-N-acetylmuramic acid kinase